MKKKKRSLCEFRSRDVLLGDISKQFPYSFFIVCLHTCIECSAVISKANNKPPGSTNKVPIFMTSIAGL